MTEVKKQTQELVKPEPREVTMFKESMRDMLSFDPDGAKIMAKCLVMWQSGLLPDTIDTPQKAFTVAQYGFELGVGLGTSFKHIYIIDQKPALEGALMASIGRALGITWKTEKDFERATEPTPGMNKTFVNRITEIHFFNKEGTMHEIGFFDKKQAVQVPHGKGKLWDKWNWRVWPRQMMWWRAFADGIRKMGVLGGYYTPDEMNNLMGPTGEMVTEQDVDKVIEKYNLDKGPGIGLDTLTVTTPNDDKERSNQDCETDDQQSKRKNPRKDKAGKDPK